MRKRLAPKPSSRNIDVMNERLAAYANGWSPMPCEGKAGVDEGWPTRKITEAVIRDWDTYKRGAGSKYLGTGIRLEGSVFIVDLDIKDVDILNAVLARIEAAHPEFYAGAIWRNSGAVSLALIGQISDQSALEKKIKSRTSRLYGRRTTDGKIADAAHIEVHTGLAKRYFAVSGPHKVEGRFYQCEGASPFNTRLDALPVFPAEKVGELIDMLEAVMAEYLDVIDSGHDSGDIKRVYDLTPETQFQIHNGDIVTAEDLESLLDVGASDGVYGVMEFDWGKSDSGTRHHAFVRDTNGRLMITDHYRDVNHYWVDEEPKPDYDPAVLAELLGVAPEAPAAETAAEPKPEPGQRGGDARRLPALKYDDLVGHSPDARIIYRPTGETWPSVTIDKRLPKMVVGQDDKGKPIKMAASTYIMKTCVVEQMSWVPGSGEFIEDVVMREGGIQSEPGARVYNLYQAPAVLTGGDAAKARRWVDHVHMVYPGADGDHVINYLACAAQRPGEKINHALMLGGAPGIGKDTILGPVRLAVGEWNFAEVRPPELFDRFNKWQRCVVLRINEMHDLGDESMYALYERLKVVTAAPPEMLRVNEKNRGEYHIPNVVKVVMTTNHKTNGIYLPAEDRRTYVAWSPIEEGKSGDEAYFSSLHAWLAAEGDRHVAAYLLGLDLSGFNAKAPPVKTEAFWSIVNANRSLTDTGIAEILAFIADRKEGAPDILTLNDLRLFASDARMHDVHDWLLDIKHRRQIPANLARHGYVETPNPDAQDGLWRLNGRRQMVYRRGEVSFVDATRAIAKRSNEKQPHDTIIQFALRPKNDT